MELKAIEVSAASNVGPFEFFAEISGYAFPHIWRLYDIPEDESFWLFTDADDEEIARLQLDEKPTLSQAGYVPGVPDDQTIQIVFLDVREQYRGSGIGRQLTAWVTSQFPNRRAVALSKEEAEGFWRTIDWEESRSVLNPNKYVMFASPLEASNTTPTL